MIDPGAVLAWGVLRLRDLPWRAARDPWSILVAEIMLQQTQALRVVPTWEAFLARYPTATVCASASLGDVLRDWHGLGYPRRARNLHEAAVAMVDHHGGQVPDDLAALLALPGVGPYTARAVLAFAFERDVAVVETNIARVLARTAGRRLTARSVQAAADALLPRRRLGLEPGTDGPRRDGVPAGAALRRLPSRPLVRLASCREPVARSSQRLRRREHDAGAVRRQRPSGPRHRPADAARRRPLGERVLATDRRRTRRGSPRRPNGRHDPLP